MAVAIPPKVSRIVDVVVSIGAAIVIIGALFKIEHWAGADQMLIVGLSTEAIIFAIYGFLYLKYPVVESDAHSEEVAFDAPGKGKGRGVLGAMDKALIEADITPDHLSRLGENFKKLNTTISNMNDIGDIVAVTGDYTQRTKEVTQALSQVKDAYLGAANSVGAFNTASESAKAFHDQVQVLTKNLSSLNTIYELELQESQNHLKTLNQFYGKLAETSAVMTNSTEDAKKVKEQIANLASNLDRLNSVYGNMLTAMQGR
ncbi:MAG: gliding motility protein GldL [Chitinophagaceae bacterium]